MTRILRLLLAGVLWTPGLAAQVATLESPRPVAADLAAARDRLLVLRDSLRTIDAGIARLQRDVRGTSPQALVARARAVRQGCRAAGRTVPSARTAVAATRLDAAARIRRREELLRSMDQLAAELERCDKDFEQLGATPGGEGVRDYGPERARRISALLRQHEAATSRFFRALGVSVAPLGADAARR